jgi:hypothetical protein
MCMPEYSLYENDGRVKQYADALTGKGNQVGHTAERLYAV